MATKTDFTDEEWTTMQKGVTGAGLLVSVGDRDFTDSFGEASALAKHLGAQRQTGSTPLACASSPTSGGRASASPTGSRRSRPRRSRR